MSDTTVKAELKTGETPRLDLQISMEIEPSFLDDIVTIAVEGGIDYWSYCTEYEWDGMPAGGTYAVIQELGDDYEVDSPDTPRHRIDAALILKGIDQLFKPYPEGEGETWSKGYIEACIRPQSLRSSVLSALVNNDAGELDAGDADNIVQIGLFNRIVYG